MPDDSTRNAATNTSHTSNGTNGVPHTDRDSLVREVVMLRARCSNLRHWCRLMLEDPAAADVLPEATVSELHTTTPEVTEAEGQVVVSLLARGGNVPPNHPLAPTNMDAASLRTTAAQLSAECERLRQAFFALFDHLHPGDDLTDEYILEQLAQGPGPSISDIIAEFEHELETRS